MIIANALPPADILTWLNLGRPLRLEHVMNSGSCLEVGWCMLGLEIAHQSAVGHVASTVLPANSLPLRRTFIAVTFKSHQIYSAISKIIPSRPLSGRHIINLAHYWSPEDILNIEIQRESTRQSGGGLHATADALKLIKKSHFVKRLSARIYQVPLRTPNWQKYHLFCGGDPTIPFHMRAQKVIKIYSLTINYLCRNSRL